MYEIIENEGTTITITMWTCILAGLGAVVVCVRFPRHLARAPRNTLNHTCPQDFHSSPLQNTVAFDRAPPGRVGPCLLFLGALSPPLQADVTYPWPWPSPDVNDLSKHSRVPYASRLLPHQDGSRTLPHASTNNLLYAADCLGL